MVEVIDQNQVQGRHIVPYYNDDDNEYWCFWKWMIYLYKIVDMNIGCMIFTFNLHLVIKAFYIILALVWCPYIPL